MPSLQTSVKSIASDNCCADFAVPALAVLTPSEVRAMNSGSGDDQAKTTCSASSNAEGIDHLAPKRNDKPAQKALYTDEQRARRDASPWTKVQAVLAPLQFVAFLISVGLVASYLMTGKGYEAATISILIKTFLLYTIMITGSIWEKDVFGEWLFVEAFFWEDVFSMLVLALQTLYVAALLNGWWTPQQQVYIAVAAYAAYVINAGQFLWKLRIARLEGKKSPLGSHSERSLQNATSRKDQHWVGQQS